MLVSRFRYLGIRPAHALGISMCRKRSAEERGITWRDGTHFDVQLKAHTTEYQDKLNRPTYIVWTKGTVSKLHVRAARSRLAPSSRAGPGADATMSGTSLTRAQ
ncbi:hypothetical protein MATL_G00253260 [Megalops atlanticus]|uniref:Uncharacterized protein n=1 Tax=Megalops atlanticus TaxID=7932 RepID=A0A9D3SUG0_MEGAT|nr:hypothetical protein MATL_G00253260 [Megalops atlanticus]